MVKTNKKKQVVVLRPTPKKSKAAKQPKADGVSAVGKALRLLGGVGGAVLGGAPGQALGTGLGAALSRWLGAGDYTVSNNSVVSKAASGIPMMHSSGQTVVVRHREMLCEVVGTSTFTVQRTFALNPGIVATFPWLSRIAACFQEYTIKGMVFHYVPTSGTYNSASPALGSVMLQTSYRANDLAPQSKVELLNEYWANESVPSEPFAHPIECDPAENPFKIQYVRAQPVSSPDSPLMYDLGNTYLATSGCPTNAVLGDLWVTYEVELKKPIIDSNITSSPGWYYESTTVAVAPNAFTALGASQGNLAVTTDGVRTLTIPRGYYGTFRFTLTFYTSAGFTGVSMSNSPSITNGTLLSVYDVIATTPVQMVGAGVGANGWAAYCCRVQKPNRDVDMTVFFPTFSIGTGSITSAVLQVTGATDL